MGKFSTTIITILLLAIFSFSCSTESTPVYQLTTSAEPSEAGTVTPATAEVEEGDSIEVSASANEHWVFDRWSGDHTGTENPASIVMDTDKSVTALFEKQEYPLTIEIEGEGSVSQQVIQSRTTDYPHGTLVELTAEPDDGWEFIEWGGDASGDENPINVTVEGETTVTATFERIEYPLTIEIEGQGNVEQRVVQSKTTDYPEGTVVELEAIADENWVFSEWSGDLESDDNPATITIDEPKTVTATFLRTYKLTTIAEPDEGGSVIPQDTVLIRDTDIDIEAIANEGWEFTGWEGDYSGDSNPLSLTMDGNKTLTANFKRIDYPLTVTTQGEGEVEQRVVQPKTTDYPFETVVELTAIPAEGWVFTGWDGDLEGSESPQTITITEEKNVTAVFERDFFDVTVSVEGEGEVDIALESGGQDNGRFEYESELTLTATAAEGWQFTGWQGDLEGDDNPASVSIDGEITVTAHFTRKEYPLTITIEGEGEVEKQIISSPKTTDYPFETVVELTAIAAEGWEFIEWGGDINSSDEVIEITIEEETHITAMFERIEYPLTIEIEGEGEVDQRVVQPKTTDYPFETVVELTAIASEGWVFTGWDGDLEGSENPQTITITEQKNVTAVFERDFFDVLVSVEGEGEVDIALESGDQDNGQFEYESVLTLTATADDGWEFAGWQGDLEGSENPETITVEGETTITALFTRKEYPLTITIEGEGEVEKQIISTPKTTDYPFETVVELTAIASEGWEFIEWSGDVSGEENPVTVTVEGETTVTATFERIEYPLTIEIEGQGNVEQSVVQSKTTDYPKGTIVELEAIADENWMFSEWSGDLEGDDNPATITIDEPKTVTATFLRTYNLTTIAEPDEGGSVIPSDTVLIRDTDIDVEAIATEGWHFTNWEGDFTGSVNPFNLTMNGNKTIVANFERNEYILNMETTGEGDIVAELISGTETADGYLFESEVSLTAIPGENWNFLRWEGDVQSEENTIEIEMDGDKTITAVFIEFAGGDGSESNPYQVANLHQLQRVGAYLNKHFIQIADIDASETEFWEVYNENMGISLIGFEPIGNQKEKFTGSYDGQGFNIQALYMERVSESANSNGLFGYLKDAVLKNVIIENVNIWLWAGGGGALVGVNKGYIENVSISGVLISESLDDSYYLGGIAGINFGTIHKSQSNVSVNSQVGTTGVGGLVGKNEGEISESHTSGSLSRPENGRYVLGGLVGINSGMITRSFSTTDIEEGALLGGLVGVNTGEGMIIDSYATGNIFGLCEAGGLVAINEGNAVIESSFSKGNVETYNILCGGGTGGLVGVNSGNALIKKYYSNGNVSSGVEDQITSVGGLIGINFGTVVEVYSTGTVTGESEYDDIPLHKGGLIGSQGQNSVVESSYWDVQASQLNDGVGSGEGSFNEIEGLQTAQMQGTAARENMPEFDWDNIWLTVTSGYPILRWQND